MCKTSQSVFCFTNIASELVGKSAINAGLTTRKPNKIERFSCTMVQTNRNVPSRKKYPVESETLFRWLAPNLYASA